MEQVSKETILSKTHYGTNIYAHILRSYYPDEVVMTIKGRDCGIVRNPFNANKPTLHIWVEKDDVLHNALDKEHAHHADTENAIPAGDAFNFAELHYKQSGDELLQTLNKEMFLHIGEKRDFYNRSHCGQAPQSPAKSPQSKSPSFGGVGEALFSFFRAPISNTKPHKAVSLADAYNYIVGDYAKDRTEKLRAFGDAKQARTFKAANFDYCTFSGTFTTRNDKALIRHSGLLCVDFDHLNNVQLSCKREQNSNLFEVMPSAADNLDNVENLFKRLLNDEYFDTQLLFHSPSGDGLKWIIRISPPLGDLGGFTHGNYFAAVSNYIQQTYGVSVDKSGRDISRACFLPHDPQAFINPNYLKQ